jgi:DNA transformation protein and related proteins
MTDSVTSIRNIGPAMATAFARAGLCTAEEIRELGADEAYRRLLLSGDRPHFIAYYALAMGLQGRPWNDCRGAEKAALRVRFDALVAGMTGTDAPPAGIEAALDALGVGDPARRARRP